MAQKKSSGPLVVGVSTVGQALGVSSLVFYCFSVFVSPLEQAFNWSRTEISLALTLASMTTVLTSPVVGALVDRYSPRILLLPSIIAQIVLLGLMTLQNGSLLLFYSFYILMPTLFVGTHSIVYSRVIITWFDQNRGLALGIALSGAGLGAIFLPPLLAGLIDAYSWRFGYGALAALVLALSLPAVYFFMHENHGSSAQRSESLSHDSAQEGSLFVRILKSIRDAWPDKAVLRNRIFQIMAVSFFLVGMSLTGVVGHLVPLLTAGGLESPQAALVASAFGFSVIIGRVGAGFLMDRYHAPLVAFCFLMGPVLGAILFGLSGDVIVLIAAALLFGLAMGAEFDMLGLFVSRYFEQTNFGILCGLIYGCFLVGGSLGPILLGLSFDLNGSYSNGLYVLSGVTLLGATVMLKLEPFSDQTGDKET